MKRAAGAASALPPGRFTPRQRDWLAIALTGVAGSVDSVAYIVLFRVLTAAMTGNTVALGIGFAQWDFSVGARRGFAIPMFLIGMLWSRFVVHLARQRGWRRAATVLFGSEALLLACFAGLGILLFPGGHIERTTGPLYYLMVALPALAMGVQNASLSHFGPLSVRTTHITGDLATLADQIALFGIWFFEARQRLGMRGALAESRKQDSLHETIFLILVWIGYLVGAVIGAFLLFRWSLAAVLPAVAGLLLLIAVDWLNPILAPQSEYDEMRRGQGIR
jgi:uncharacterized membrane protein YoaK (UPF0700 family)